MRNFYWRGKTSTGRIVRGSLEGEDRAHIQAKLRSQEIEPLQLFSLPILEQRIAASHITLLIRQLATLLNSGLPLPRALEGMIAGQPRGPMHRLCKTILSELRQGQTFSSILAARPHYFEPFLIHLVRSGEQSSQLPHLLERAAEYREQMHTLRRQAWKAVSYPLGVLLFTLAISLFLLLQVVPQFETLFHNLGGTLPPLTLHVLSLAHLVEAHFLQIIVLLVAAPVITTIGYRTLPPLQWVLGRILLSLPLIGVTLQEMMVARLGRTLATLHQATIPLHIGLEDSQQMTRLLPLQHAILQISEAVERGDTLSQAMGRQTLFPSIAIQMVHAGEESGELTEMLERLASYYEDEANNRIQRLTALFEPVIILLVGVLVGIVAIALYQPIFQMGQQL